MGRTPANPTPPPTRFAGLLRAELLKSVLVGVIVAVLGALGSWLYNQATEGGVVRLLNGVTRADFLKEVDSLHKDIKALNERTSDDVTRADFLKEADSLHKDIKALDERTSDDVARADFLKEVDSLHKDIKALDERTPAGPSSPANTNSADCILGNWACSPLGSEPCGSTRYTVSKRPGGDWFAEGSKKTYTLSLLDQNRYQIEGFSKLDKGTKSPACNKIEWSSGFIWTKQ